VAGTPVVVLTDNQAVAHLESVKNGNATLARWSMELSRYDFKIKHRSGKTHGNADGLTRANQRTTTDAQPLDVMSLTLPVDPVVLATEYVDLDEEAPLLPTYDCDVLAVGPK
jgi:hypothetical protein